MQINDNNGHGSAIQIKLQFNCIAHKKSVVGLKYSTCGNYLASVSADEKVHIYNTASGDLMTVLEGEHTRGINDIVWINETLIATGSDDQTVKVWDIVKKKVINSYKGNKSFVYSLAVNPINRVIASGGLDGSVQMFHLSMKDPIMNFDGHSEAIVSLDFHNNGRELLSAGQDGLIRIWDSLYPSCCIKTIVCDSKEPTPLSCVSYSPNNKYLLVSSLDSTHKLFHHESVHSDSQPVILRSYQGHCNRRYSIHSCIYRNYLISGSEDNKVFLWDLQSTDIVQELEGHQESVLAVAGNPNEDVFQIASGGVDCSIKFWSLANAE